MTDRSQDQNEAGARHLEASLAEPFSSQAEFELALPLYVGGDLSSGEASRVDAWIESHPESRSALEAAEAARSVLRDHAHAAHARNTPDLWAGIRGELARSGLVGAGERSLDLRGQAGEVGTGTGIAGAPIAAGSTNDQPELAPILGGPRWFQRKSVAAAAAVMLVGGIGALLSGGGSNEADPANGVLPVGVNGTTSFADSNSVAATMGVSDTTDQAIDGERLDRLSRTVRLHRPAPDAGHLIDEAEAVRLWQLEAITLGQPGDAGQLASSRD